MTAKAGKRVQKLNIRLIKAGIEPDAAVRAGVALQPYSKIENALFAVGPSGGNSPKWSSFLELEEKERARLKNLSAYGLLFLQARGRWFAIAFGQGFQKLLPTSFEQNFGLRVVVNAVDEKKLRSADMRTPDENTTTTRTQASRYSSQEVFEIDHERDLVKGLEGVPRDLAFATRVYGSDALTLWRSADVSDLPAICGQAFDVYGEDKYKANFSWIDHIRHERDSTVLSQLDSILADAVTSETQGHRSPFLHLAWPIIYAPETANCVRYLGFRSKQVFSDLDVRNYIAELQMHGVVKVTPADLTKHEVMQTDEDGTQTGESFPLYDCFVFETDHAGNKYVLSGGLWYQIDRTLAAQVANFFDKVKRFAMPKALAENEQEYVKRIALEKADSWVCMDTELVKPTDARTQIEVCDFLQSPSLFIHLKDQSASSKLSHLFNQGYVSALTFRSDSEFRTKVREKALEVSGGKLGGDMPDGAGPIEPSKFTIVFGVLREPPAKGLPLLPFFSLIAFRHIAKELDAIGFRYAFAWILKDAPSAGKPKKTKPKAV